MDKTVLILSAGGVFGAYQAGVWKALSGWFEPDAVVGASIGSVNGWLIAAGCPPAELEDLWLHADEVLATRPRMPRHWSHGVLDPRWIEERLESLCGRFSPRIPLTVVLTQLSGFRPVLASAPDLNHDHLLASCAVPGAFNLRRIANRYYADGGLMAALPLWAGPAIGATRMIAVNAMPPPPAPIGFVSKAMRRRADSAVAGSVPTVLIQPSQPLGPYFSMLNYRPEKIRDWIEAGRLDAEQLKHSISECFERQ